VTDTPISVIQKAADLGLKLGVRPGDKLTVQPIERCPTDFVKTLREHKMRLLDLLRLPFVMVFSEMLQETIFFCEDEVTKAALVAAGAEPGCVYTRYELRVIIEQHRRAPITAAELLRIHGTRRTFNGRLAR
jgi:hypothetical protein